MAEILIQVVDKVNADDFYLNVQCHKRGDVVVAMPDDCPWGSHDLSLPFWRILKLPNVSLTQAQAFLQPELDIDPANPSRTLQLRSHKLDIDHALIPAGVKAWFADDSRAQPFITITNAQLAASQIVTTLRKAKPSITDPNVIGQPSTIIG